MEGGEQDKLWWCPEMGKVQLWLWLSHRKLEGRIWGIEENYLP